MIILLLDDQNATTMKTSKKTDAKLFAWGFSSILTMFPHLPNDLLGENSSSSRRARHWMNEYDIDLTQSVESGLASHWNNVGAYFTTVINNYERREISASHKS